MLKCKYGYVCCDRMSLGYKPKNMNLKAKV